MQVSSLDWVLMVISIMVLCTSVSYGSVDEVAFDNLADFASHRRQFDTAISSSDSDSLDSESDIRMRRVRQNSGDSPYKRTSESVTLFPSDSNDTITPSNIVSSCTVFVEKFSEAAANFTRCSIIYARPLRFCEKCVNHYVDVKSIFNLLMKGLNKDDDGNLCGDTIVNSDRIQIVAKTAEFIDELWDDCDCGNCFEPFNKTDYTMEVHMSNDSYHFLELEHKIEECFHNFTDGDIFPYTANTSAVCKECSHNYHALNDFYMELEEKYSHHVCMDIVDTMNYTRLKWSQDFKCSQQQGDLLAVLLLSAFFCTLPIVFYSSLKVYGVREANRMLHEKRMRDVTVTSNATDSASE